MNCPVDNTQLQMTERQGIEIDYCPTCRGVWLDRGELDKIIERSATAYAAPAGDASSPVGPGMDRSAAPDRGYDTREQAGHRGYRYDDDDDDDRRRYGPGGPGPYDRHGRRKKRSFLDDLFDFD